MAYLIDTYALPAAVNMADVAGSASVIVAVPEWRGNGYYRSGDGGATWTSYACMLPTQSPSEVYWNGSYFLAVGNEQCAKSTDGITWTTGTLSGTEATFDLAWNGSLWVAGRDDKISTSPDGLTWTDRALPLAGWHVITDVIWDGARFCALAEDQNSPWGWFFWTSSDGLTWTSTSALPTPGDGYSSLAYNGSVYVTANTNTGGVAYSADGVTWATTSPLDLWWLLGSLNGEVLAQDGVLGFKTTTDGATWSATTPTVTGPAVVDWSRPDHARAGADGLYAVGSGQFAYLRVAPPPPEAFWTDLQGTTETEIVTNTLEKDTDVAVTAGSAGRPATPGTPGRNAYYAWEDVQVSGMFIEGATYAWVTPTDGNEPQYMLVATGATPGIVTYKTITTRKLVYYPAVAPTPAVAGAAPEPSTTMRNYRLGWNAGARSLDFIVGDGSATFTLVSAVGVAVGLNAENTGTQYGEIEHGFLLSSGLVRIIESGAVVASVGTYAMSDVFAIKRMDGLVTYWRNGSLVYTSASPSSGTVFLDAAMYSGGDEITAPAIGAICGANLTLPALGAMGGIAAAQASLVLPALTISTSFFQGAALVLPALTAHGGAGNHGMASLTLPALTVTPSAGSGSGSGGGHAEGGWALPPYALATPILPALQVSGYMLTGEIGGAAMTLPALAGLGSDRIYGDARLTLPALSLFSESNEGPLAATMGDLLTTAGSIEGAALLAVVMTSSGAVAGAFSCTLAMPVAMDEAAQVTDTMTAQALLAALMEFGAVASFTQSGEGAGVDSDWQVWSLNWDGGADTAYESFDFNSFAKIEDRYYGAKAGGVYLLEGDDDAGADIRASLHFGRHDFGSSSHKRVPHAYAGVSASGALVLRVQVDGGAAYTYTARATAASQKTQRFDLGKGLKGSFYAFELYNVAGCDFDLDSIEFHPVELTRKI